jgi:ATP-dependent protease Clp ATPase subunit
MASSCSWCWKEPSEVAVLLEGFGGVAICDECVELCMEVIAERKLTGKTKSRGAELEALLAFQLRSNARGQR